MSLNAGRLAALALAGLAALQTPGIAGAAPAAPGLDFETVFSDAGQPQALHYSVRFMSRNAMHRMEVWRDGETQLKRTTDDAIDTFVSREAGSPEFTMTILDGPRKIATRVDRSNLYRVGNFTDWWDLAHGLRHPQGAYTLAHGQAPEGVSQPAFACDWYDLTQAGQTVHVCWSAQARLPMLLVSETGQTLWETTAWDARPVARAIFEIHDTGFVRNDVNEEMDRD